MKRGSKRQHLAGDEATYCTKPPGTTLASACQGKQAALTLGLLEQTQPEFWGLLYREGLRDGWESAREIPATTHGCWKEHCCWDVSTSAPEDWHHGGTMSCPSSRDPLQNKTQTALLSSPVLLPCPSCSLTAKPSAVFLGLQKRSSSTWSDSLVPLHFFQVCTRMVHRGLGCSAPLQPTAAGLGLLHAVGARPRRPHRDMAR